MLREEDEKLVENENYDGSYLLRAWSGDIISESRSSLDSYIHVTYKLYIGTLYSVHNITMMISIFSTNLILILNICNVFDLYTLDF